MLNVISQIHAHISDRQALGKAITNHEKKVSSNAPFDKLKTEERYKHDINTCNETNTCRRQTILVKFAELPVTITL